jgi:hypothetical protein
MVSAALLSHWSDPNVKNAVHCGVRAVVAMETVPAGAAQGWDDKGLSEELPSTAAAEALGGAADTTVRTSRARVS